MAKQTKNEAEPQPPEPTTGGHQGPPQLGDADAAQSAPGGLVTLRAHADSPRPEDRELAQKDEEKDQQEPTPAPTP